MKLKQSLIDKILLGAIIAVDLYYAVYLVMCLFGIDSIFMIFFALAVMAVVTLPYIFRERLHTRLGRAYAPLRAIFTALVCFYVISVLLFWGYIGADGTKTAEAYAAQASIDSDSGEGTLVVIFGCRTYAMTPSDTLRLRLDEGYELLSSLPDALCIVSGGQGSNETVPEAVAMKAYLVERGISPERIFEEANSHSTSENVRFSKALADELELEYERVIGVSTAFHLPRIETLAAGYWQKIDVCAAPPPSAARHYVSMIREYLSYIKMLIFDTSVFSK